MEADANQQKASWGCPAGPRRCALTPAPGPTVVGVSGSHPGKEGPAPTTGQSPASTSHEGPEGAQALRTVPRFVEPPLECACPSWSPDGKFVMFVARPTEQAGGNSAKSWMDSGVLPGNIWVASADGSKRWLVSSFFFGKQQPPGGRAPIL